MRIGTCQDTAFYRPRQPWDSPLYRLVEEHYEEFERVYPERFQARHGFWRPVIRKAVFDCLKCGDLREGFARVRCPDCRHEFFVAFSCKQRCVCPSCHPKRRLVTSINIAENICAPVPRRQFVFTMPKRFRLYFRFNRELLRKLPRLARETVLEVCQAVLGRDDVVPGMTAATCLCRARQTGSDAWADRQFPPAHPCSDYVWRVCTGSVCVRPLGPPRQPRSAGERPARRRATHPWS